MIDTTPESTRPHRITSARSMLDGRRDDSMRRRQRVLAVLDRAGGEGDQISVSAIAHAAGVDRTFLYRHRDLLEKIHALQADPVTDDEHTGPAVTRASLQADLLAAHERIARLGARIQQLEKRLSEELGEQTWRQSGLGAPADIDTSTSASASSNSTTSNFSNNSTNARKTSPQPAPPTANSWPDSTHQPGCDDTRKSACTTPVAADSISGISF